MTNQRFKVFGRKDLASMRELARFSEQDRFAMDIVARVFPFRVNQYVLDSLID